MVGYAASYDIASIINAVKDIIGGVTVEIAKNAPDLGQIVVLFVFLAAFVGVALKAKQGWRSVKGR